MLHALLFLLSVSFAFLPVNMKDSAAAVMGCAGSAGGVTERQRIERDWFPPPAAPVQSQPADFRGAAGPGMSPAGPSCLSAGRTSPQGPGQAGGTRRKKQLCRQRSEARSGHKCTVCPSVTHTNKHLHDKYRVAKLFNKPHTDKTHPEKESQYGSACVGF